MKGVPQPAGVVRIPLEEQVKLPILHPAVPLAEVLEYRQKNPDTLAKVRDVLGLMARRIEAEHWSPGFAKADRTGSGIMALRGISKERNLVVLIAAAILIAIAYVEYQERVNEQRKASAAGQQIVRQIEGGDRSRLWPIEQGALAAVADSDDEVEDIVFVVEDPGGVLLDRNNEDENDDSESEEDLSATQEENTNLQRQHIF